MQPSPLRGNGHHEKIVNTFQHQPPFFYWRIADDPRRQRLYARLLARHAGALRAYRQQVDGAGAYFLFTRTTPEAA